MVVTVTKDNYPVEVLSAKQPVLLDFWAPWCGPCQALAPLLDEFALSHPHIKICKINVDDEMELARQFRVMTIPTLVVMHNGEPQRRISGVLSMPQVLELFDE